MSEQARIETAIDTTIDNCEVLRARLAKYEDDQGNPKATPSAKWKADGEPDPHAGRYECERAKLAMGHLTDDELANGAFMNYDAPLNPFGILAGTHSSPIAWMTAVKDRIRWLSRSLEQARAALSANHSEPVPATIGLTEYTYREALKTLREVLDPDDWMGEISMHAFIDAALSANHSDQVREGWQLVPVEPIDAMLEAGDKYIGTPATYKAMLSACPSPAITKDFSQFLSAVMDAAGLIRHGRQSKELSEYLGMKCMEYRGAAPSAGSQGGDV